MNFNNICLSPEIYEKQINKIIYQYLLHLMIYIFIRNDCYENKFKGKEIELKLKAFTEHINKKIIKKEQNYIKMEPKDKAFTYKNFLNIINFVKKQNLMLAGNILEGILIIIFSCKCTIPKEDYFGKYVYNNFEKLLNESNSVLPQWFNKAQGFFQNNEIKNIEVLLANDVSRSDPIYAKKEMPIFLKLLYKIAKMKYNYIISSLDNNKFNLYMNKGPLNIMKMELILFNILKCRKNHSVNEYDFYENSIGVLYYYFFNDIRSPIKLIQYFLISVYIYCQNSNSSLIKYTDLPKKKPEEKNEIENIIEEESEIQKKEEKEKTKGEEKKQEPKEKEKELVDVPYTFELKGANIKGKISNTIISPLLIEPRISKIDFTQNPIRELGLYELGKILSFNTNIKSITLRDCSIFDYYLDFFIKGFGVFDNYSLEELNLSFNSLKENSIYVLSKLLKHLKGLKTLIISGNNDLKGGARFLFIILKDLYKKGQTNLENLYIYKCSLTDSSFYELGELLKSPFCGLKRLNLSLNQNCFTINFLKKFKLNRSLEELIVARSNFNTKDIDNICRIISNCNLMYLNVFKNKFDNFGKYLRIIFRTKLIKKKTKANKLKNSNIDLSKSLRHLDLSKNSFFSINYQYIKKINDLIQDNSTLSCLDISRIFYGSMADQRTVISKDKYKNAITKLTNTLRDRKEQFEKYLMSKFDNEVILKEYEKKNKDVKINPEDFDDDISNYIEEVIEHKYYKYPAFLREQSIQIIKKIYENKENEKNKKLIEKEKLIENFDFNSDENNKFITKLEKYMTYVKRKRRLIEINKELEWKNLIII